MTKAKTSMDIEENLASSLCYLLIWISGIIFYLIEKENKTVKFHAMQSILTFLPLTVLSIFFSALWFIPFAWILNGLIWLITVILWLILVIKAYQGEKFKLPFVGDIAEKNI